MILTKSTWFWYHSISIVDVDLLPVYFRFSFPVFLIGCKFRVWQIKNKKIGCKFRVWQIKSKKKIGCKFRVWQRINSIFKVWQPKICHTLNTNTPFSKNVPILISSSLECKMKYSEIVNKYRKDRCLPFYFLSYTNKYKVTKISSNFFCLLTGFSFV